MALSRVSGWQSCSYKTQASPLGAQNHKLSCTPARAMRKVSAYSQQDEGSSPAAWVPLGLGVATSAMMLLNVMAGPVLAQEIASIAADSALDDAAEAGRTLLPDPSGLFNKEKAAQNAEAQEKRAVDAPQSSFKAASPVGGEGEVSNLADQGLKGGAQFEAAAKALNSVSSEAQYNAAQELDKKLQKEDDFARAAQFKKDAPGSSAGNSVIGRTESQITGGGDRPQAPSMSSIFNLGGK